MGTRAEREYFLHLTAKPSDMVPLRTFSPDPREPAWRTFDYLTEHDEDCPDCVGHRPHTWEVHDAAVTEKRLHRCRNGIDPYSEEA